MTAMSARKRAVMAGLDPAIQTEATVLLASVRHIMLGCADQVRA
jgi:hypothetical protein